MSARAGALCLAALALGAVPAAHAQIARRDYAPPLRQAIEALGPGPGRAGEEAYGRLATEIARDLAQEVPRPWSPSVVERRYAGLSRVPALAALTVRADTLAGGLLLAVARGDLGSLRLFEYRGREVRPIVLGPPPDATAAGAARALERLVLAAPGSPGGGAARCALFWYSLPGGAATHELWVLTLPDSGRRMRFAQVAVGEADSLEVISRRGDVRLRTLAPAGALSPVVEPAAERGVGLRLERRFRLLDGAARLARAAPADDAAFAVTRALEAERGLSEWPSGDVALDAAVGRFAASAARVTLALPAAGDPAGTTFDLAAGDRALPIAVTRGPGGWRVAATGPPR